MQLFDACKEHTVSMTGDFLWVAESNTIKRDSFSSLFTMQICNWLSYYTVNIEVTWNITIFNRKYIFNPCPFSSQLCYLLPECTSCFGTQQDSHDAFSNAPIVRKLPTSYDTYLSTGCRNLAMSSWFFSMRPKRLIAFININMHYLGVAPLPVTVANEGYL